MNVCPLRWLEEQKVVGNNWKNDFCLSEGNLGECKRYQLEEKGVVHPDNLLPDGKYMA